MAAQTGIRVSNRTNESVWCGITNKTNPQGNGNWFELKPYANDFWSRSGWETVCFKDRLNQRNTSLWINRGSPAWVYFDGFDKELSIVNDYRPAPEFVVKNTSERS